MGFAVLPVWDETNHKAQRAMVDFLKMAEKRLDKNGNERMDDTANFFRI